MRGSEGLERPMSVRAASLAPVFGAMVLGTMILGAMVLSSASAAERGGECPPPTRASNDFPLASEVRLGGDDAQTRMVVDLSQKIEVHAFTLANPYRVVVDMPQVTFQFPPKTGEKGRG